MPKTTRKCFFESYCMCKNTGIKLKYQFPIGCAHTQGDCGKVLPPCQWLPIVELSGCLCVLSARLQMPRQCLFFPFIHLKVKSSTVRHTKISSMRPKAG